MIVVLGTSLAPGLCPGNIVRLLCQTKWPVTTAKDSSVWFGHTQQHSSMSSREDEYGRSLAGNERMVRRGTVRPSHHKGHVRADVQQLARPIRVSSSYLALKQRRLMVVSIFRDLQACSQAAPDAQGTSHSLLRTPLFGSAVPRRQRTGTAA